MAFIEENSLFRRFIKTWHLLGACITLYLAYNFTRGEEGGSNHSIFGSCFYSTITFLLSWGINFGMTSWVSFIAGYVMYKNLDRPTFSSIQGKLFPIYFTLMGLTSLVQFGVFVTSKRNIRNLSRHEYTTMLSIAAGIVCGFLNCVWLVPAVTKLSFKKIMMEREAGGASAEVKERLKENHEYRKLSKDFGIYHGISSILNLLAFSGSVYVMYYVALELFESTRELRQ